MRKEQLLMYIIGLLIKYPKILLMTFPLLLGWYGLEVFSFRPSASFEGVPKTQSWGWSHILRNDHFMLEYDEQRKNPLWVVYKIHPLEGEPPHVKRPSDFKVDNRTLARVTQQAYTNSGYDRGHMAPNHAIVSLYGKASQADTFLMSNITPQRPNLNRKIWQRLEAAEMDQMTHLGGKIAVFTGPIFGKTPQRLPSGIQIPEAFFKIYATKKGKEIHLLAFIIPQDVGENARIPSYITTVDAVEAATHLDFFSRLNDAQENRLESQTDTTFWNVTQMDSIKNRTF